MGVRDGMVRGKRTLKEIRRLWLPCGHHSPTITQATPYILTTTFM